MIMEGFFQREAHSFSLRYYRRCTEKWRGRPRVVEGESEFSFFNKSLDFFFLPFPLWQMLRVGKAKAEVWPKAAPTKGEDVLPGKGGFGTLSESISL